MLHPFNPRTQTPVAGGQNIPPSPYFNHIGQPNIYEQQANILQPSPTPNAAAVQARFQSIRTKLRGFSPFGVTQMIQKIL